MNQKTNFLMRLFRQYTNTLDNLIRLPAITGESTHHSDVINQPELSIREMNTNLNEASAKNGKIGVSYQRYRQVVADMNIGFTKLGEEESEICNLNDKHTHDNNDNTEECTHCDNTSIMLESAEKDQYGLWANCGFNHNVEHGNATTDRV